MWVSRLRVNGGFLNGLDVSFVQGLNVVIGPRGVGKTTLLELIRHAIGAEHADKTREAARQSLLTAVLGTGDVILDLQDDAGGFQLIVDAKGRGRREDISQSVLVLGQSELEDIASDAASRLKLLDLRSGDTQTVPSRDRVAELTMQMHDLRKSLERMQEEGLKRAGLEADREIYRSQEASIVGEAGSALAAERDSLRSTEEQATRIAQTVDTFARAGEVGQELASATALAKGHLRRLRALISEIEPSATSVPSQIDVVDEHLEIAGQWVASVANQLAAESAVAKSREAELKEIAAPIRARLEQAEAGLGQLTAQIRNIDSQLRDLDTNDARILALEHDMEVLRTDREAAYAEIEQAEERIFLARLAVAEVTSQQIDSHIVVVVEHLSDSSELRELLLDAMKGTHTRATLIDSLAARLLPRLLLEIVEAQDIAALSSAGDITFEQAGRVITALDSRESLAKLARVALLDSVDFLLRDGSVDKSVDTLSTGQKCAVTLPIVLSERNRTLILDQPEDHLDNAYLVDHVVTGMDKRSAQRVQTIVATHNANIPVLGSAGRVFVLASDGQHGQVSEVGAFDDDAIVRSITTLMEGGREAFERRHDFYLAHGSLEP